MTSTSLLNGAVAAPCSARSLSRATAGDTTIASRSMGGPLRTASCTSMASKIAYVLRVPSDHEMWRRFRDLDTGAAAGAAAGDEAGKAEGSADEAGDVAAAAGVGTGAD